MAARSGNDADGRRTMASRAGVLLRALTLAAFAAGIWCLTGTATAVAGERLALRHSAPGVSVLGLAVPGRQSAEAHGPIVPPAATSARTASRRTAFLRTAFLRTASLRTAAVVPDRDAVPQPVVPWADGGVPPPDAAPVSRAVDPLLQAVRHRLVVDGVAVVSGTTTLVPRASRGGSPRSGVTPAGAGTAQWPMVGGASPRTPARPDPVAFAGRGPFPTPEGSAAAPAGSAQPAGIGAVPRQATPTVRPARDSARDVEKTPGLCALAHDTSAPPAPLCSSWVASRTVPALCLRSSEPPVSPD
jgi:hypothetical protein